MKKEILTNDSLYLLRALQVFAHLLNTNYDNNFLEETDKEILFHIIEEYKKNTPAANFYYNAGRTSQQVLVEELVKNPDGYTQCLSGLYLFDELIGLRGE